MLASRHPDRFNRLVIGGLCGSILVRREGPSPAREAARGEVGGDDPLAGRFRALIDSVGNDPDALTAFLDRDQPRLDREHLAAVTHPTLIILGDQDFSGPGEPLAEAIVNPTLVTLRGVDHFGLPKSFDFVDRGLEHLGAAPF